jgi:hypothetical protein
MKNISCLIAIGLFTVSFAEMAMAAGGGPLTEEQLQQQIIQRYIDDIANMQKEMEQLQGQLAILKLELVRLQNTVPVVDVQAVEDVTAQIAAIEKRLRTLEVLIESANAMLSLQYSTMIFIKDEAINAKPVPAQPVQGGPVAD